MAFQPDEQGKKKPTIVKSRIFFQTQNYQARFYGMESTIRTWRLNLKSSILQLLLFCTWFIPNKNNNAMFFYKEFIVLKKLKHESYNTRSYN